LAISSKENLMSSKLMSNDPELSSLVIEDVKALNPNAENFLIIFVQPEFLEGRLYVVQFQTKERKEEHATIQNFVYMVGKKIIYTATNTALLVELVSRKGRKLSAFGVFLQVGGIAGIIAILLTMTICSLYLWSDKEVPALLSTTLTTIIGFYFGTKVATSDTTV
jgi:hypothetical protein